VIAAGFPTGIIGSPGSLGLARFLPDGTLDATFGTGGVAIANLGEPAEGWAAVVQPDGNIVAGGMKLTSGHGVLVAISPTAPWTRRSARGTPDPAPVCDASNPDTLSPSAGTALARGRQRVAQNRMRLNVNG
jgi:hypothetical protein